MSSPVIYGYIRDGSSPLWHLTTDPTTERPVTLCGTVLATPTGCTRHRSTRRPARCAVRWPTGDASSSDRDERG